MTPYYNGIIKKAITIFGKLFSEFSIQRIDNNGNIVQTVAIPIAYSNKQKWLTRIEQDPTQSNYTMTSMPRFGFEISSYEYDASRKVGKMRELSNPLDESNSKNQYAPVPYNLSISLFLQTKNVEDGLMVMEQILPMFQPEYTISINAIPDMDIINNIPLILTGVTVEDDFENDFVTVRSIIHTFSFQMKLNLFGSIRKSGVIKQVTVNLPNQPERYYTSADSPGHILTDSWTLNYQDGHQTIFGNSSTTNE